MEKQVCSLQKQVYQKTKYVFLIHMTKSWLCVYPSPSSSCNPIAF